MTVARGKVMSIDTDGIRVVHFPKYKDVFKFDEEVSRVFPDMAVRSIPLYEEAHRLHVSLFLGEMKARGTMTCYDVGASRGHFFKQICNQFQIDPSIGDARFDFVAVDNSGPMLKLLLEEMPWVRVVEENILYLPDLAEPADYICMMYLLQFLQDDTDKATALQWAYRNLATGGVLFLGQKDKEAIGYEDMFSEEYYRFRMANGYTIEEIRAKTLALKGSMHTISPVWLESLVLLAGFKSYVETTRWLQFSTAFCIK